MFFTPRYVKDARQYCEAARRVVRYRLDLLNTKQVEELDQRIADLESAARERNREKVKTRMTDLERVVGRAAPPQSHSGWRENCEVILIAIIIVAGVRAYLLEPFKIPTGSMQPTLNGVIGYPSNAPQPNLFLRAFDFVVRGRTFINVTATQDDNVERLEEKSILTYFTWTNVICEHSRYTIFAPAAVVANNFGIRGRNPYTGAPGTRLEKGKPVVQGYVDNGDFVIVNKLAYNFMPPKRGDVFVFLTTDIKYIENEIPEDLGSQHYIKRIAGLPGDELRIAEPLLFVNGELAKEKGFARVMAQKNGYTGYTNPPIGASYLTESTETFAVPEKCYFALGDNSRFSSDSRYWGIVPERNITGKAFVAFWPFTSHWGFIE